MSLRLKSISNLVPFAVIVIGLLSVAKLLLIQFSLSESEGENRLLRACLFLLFNSVSISGVIAIWNFRIAWMALLLAQLVSATIFVITRTFGQGTLELNEFVLQHFIVVALALVLMIFADRASKIERKYP